jgi:hypothetical protein
MKHKCLVAQIIIEDVSLGKSLGGTTRNHHQNSRKKWIQFNQIQLKNFNILKLWFLLLTYSTWALCSSPIYTLWKIANTYIDYKKSCIMQPSNLRLYATKYHLQLCFIIFTTSHHIFQFITFLATLVTMPKMTNMTTPMTTFVVVNTIHDYMTM